MSGVLLWLWNPVTGEWDKAPAAVNTKRMVGVGQVAAGVHKLHWLVTNPSAINSVFVLTDDTTGLTATVLDGFSIAKNTFPVYLNPPIHFATGIYLKTFTNMASITFGYT